MPKFLAKLPEWRILAYLAIIALAWHLLNVFGSLLSLFADVFLLVFLSWLLAFIIEPLVAFFVKRGFPRVAAAIFIYFALAAILIGLVITVLPTTISQFTQLSSLLPSYLPQNPLWSTRLESFFTSTFNNSIVLASQIANTLSTLLLVFILSFYLLLSRADISRFVKGLIPHDYKEDYEFLQNTLNTTFATFLRVQVLLGLVLGVITFLVFLLFHLDYALSTGLLSAILGMIPVVGSALFLLPPLLATFVSAPSKLLLVAAILLLSSQLVYNVWGPRLLGKALQIHPIVVLLSFLVGYKIAGVWGAIFAVPITSALFIIARDVISYWQEEADRS